MTHVILSLSGRIFRDSVYVYVLGIYYCTSPTLSASFFPIPLPLGTQTTVKISKYYTNSLKTLS